MRESIRARREWLRLAPHLARPLRFVLPTSVFFQAGDGIRGADVTGVQTCALPIYLLGATLAERLLGISCLELAAFPLVGKGRAYTALGIPLVMPGREFPSGGFLRNSLKNLLMDLRSGLIGFTRKQVQALRANRDRFDLVVCLGDLYPLLLAGTFLRAPVFFLPTAKSDYIRAHGRLEVRLI